jgi:hypothetical protein
MSAIRNNNADHVGYDLQKELPTSPLAGLPLETKANNPGTGVGKADTTIWINSANGHAYRGSYDLETSGGVGGGGDVVGPSGASENSFAQYDGFTGKLIKNSTFNYTDNVNNPRINIFGWANLLFTKTNTSMFMGYNSGKTYADSQVGSTNCAYGPESMRSHTGGSGNTSMGSFSQFARTNQSNNTSYGGSALQNLNAGTGGNTCVGSSALQRLISGNDNVCVGKNAGFNYGGAESNNVLLDNVGVVGESNTTRIGTTQTRAFIAGVSGVTPSGASVPVVIDAQGQLGTGSGTPGGTTGYQELSISSLYLKPLPLSEPELVEFMFELYAYAFPATGSRSLMGSFQLPYDYKAGTALDFHIMWSPSNSVEVANVRWEVLYSIANINAVFPGVVGDGTEATTSGLDNTYQYTTLATINGTGLTTGAIIHFRVSRNGSAVSDFYTAPTHLHRVGLRYESTALY